MRQINFQAMVQQKRQYYPIIALIVITMAAASLFLYRTIYNTIVSINVDSMHEMTMHDLRGVTNTLDERWDDMAATVEDIRMARPTSTMDMLAMLSNGDDYVDCKLLALTGSDGWVYRSTGVVGLPSDQALYEEIIRHEGRFAMRFDYLAGAQVENSREYILIGSSITPFTVDGVSFDHVFALLPIDSIEKDLVITSFDGQGVGFIIDENGYYIVNSNRSHNFTFRANYFKDIADMTIGGYAAPEELIADLKAGTASIATTISDDTNDYVVTIQKMEYSPWYYISYVPERVFEAQTHKILGILGGVMLITFLAVLFAIVHFLRSKEKEIRLLNVHRVELEEALSLAEKASRAKTTFLNSMSHDIRTPMNAIIGFAKLATGHIGDGEAIRSYLAKITKSSEHLLALINDVLDMSRIEAGKINFAYKNESLTDILSALADMFHSDIAMKEIDFSLDMSGVTDDWIVCDKLRLNQVLLNVTSNAFKYTNPGGSIALTVTQCTTEQDGHATYKFIVKDTGIGMSEEFVKTIFEPFTRENTATVSGIQGTGLGMAITHHIVEMMGGRIAVASRLHEGTEVTVTLDFELGVAPADAGASLAEDGSADKASLAGKRILLAEDNELNCELAVELLEDEGFVVETAENGQVCVDMLTQADAGHFDVILMDIQMPVMNGLAAARTIRALPDAVKAGIPIIALSANTFEEDKQSSRAAGMNAHVAKPIEMAQLLTELHKLLGE